MRILKKLFPFLEWFERFDLATLRVDFVAGLTVALVLVPQSMAYAQLAGLPAYYGLYAAFLPPVVASLFGSSRQLATGPVAVVSLMTSTALQPLATAGSEAFVAYAILLALLVGVFQLVLGLLRLGLVVNFLSHPVVNGFTNAAALIIATSQLSKIFGVRVDAAPHHYETVARVIAAAFRHTHLPTLGMAVLSFAVMIVLRRVNPRIPNVLAAVVVTTLLSWAVGFESNETVPVAAIESPRVGRLVGDFNQAVETKESLEEMRTRSSAIRKGFESGTRGSCLRCHERRELGLLEKSPGTRAGPRDIPGRALALHQMAGLLDEHISELATMASTHRGRIREIELVKTKGSETPPRFFERERVPAGIAVEDGTWRLDVGGNRLDLDAIRVVGGGAVVARIPEGLPSIRLPRIDWSVVPTLLSAAMIISLLGFMEAISIAKAMAARTRQKLDPNQELVGQGLANIVGCMGQSYAVSGSFSRSAVNLQAGARTGLSNVFSGVVVMIVLLFFSKTLYHLPQAVLASIIMMAVVGLLNVSGFMHAWRTNRFDGIVSVVTFVGTLALAPHLEWGIFTGVLLSLGAYLFRTMRPRVVGLAPHSDGAMRDARRHGLKKCRRIAVVSFEGPLIFASASYLESEMLNHVAELPDLKHILVSGNGITEIDASGEETLRHLVERLRGAGYGVSFSGLSDAVLDVLRRSHLYERIGEGHFFGTRAQAIAAIFAGAHEGPPETDCPYHEAMPPMVELSLHPDGSLRNAERHGLRLCRHVAALRFDVPLAFASMSLLAERVLGIVADRPGLRHVIFVAHSLGGVDAAGARKLGELAQKLRAEGLAVSFSGFKEEVVDALAQTHVDEVIGAENIYPTQVMAVAGVYARAHAGSSEQDCPLLTLAPRLTEVSVHPDGSLRDARRHGLKRCEHIGVLRFDGPLVLASRKAIQSEFIRWAKTRPSVTNIVFVAHTIQKLDRSEVENLVALVNDVREAGYRVVFAAFTDRAFEDLAKGGGADAIGLDDLYATEPLALAGIFSDAHAAGTDRDCPLRDMLPSVVELSLHPDGSYRDAQRHGLALCRHIAMLRFDGPLNFATVAFFADRLLDVLARRPKAKHVLIAGHTLERLDATAAEELASLVVRLRGEGRVVSFSGLRDQVLDVLRSTGRWEAIGKDAVHPSQEKAVDAIFDSAHRGSDEAVCPLRRVVQDA